eukprot:TRINITY_DN72_c0_g2_i3.p1 TRINITY_DN72_c0_g2~~TRINITY_DN72_c0_g2_i3.p1  ORF type:complete len:344 (-),score=44.17 TRINITY_DN72_c0_g2_i3:251-1282(-)
MDIVLSKMQVVDLFLRFSTVGLLMLLALFLIKHREKWPAPQIAVISCIIGYILLTAPIEDKHYGGLRNVLLLATDSTPYAFLWLTMTQLSHRFSLSSLHVGVKILAVVWGLVLTYFFLVYGGYGFLHDVSHAVGVVVLLAIIYICLAEFFDDVDDKRRNARMLIALFCCCYMVGLVSFEFANKAIRNSVEFSFINSLFIFILAFFIATVTIFKRSTQAQEVILSDEKGAEESIPVLALKTLMSNGVYLQSELTIGKLAEQVNVPAHQLRQIINQQLGFSNFSHYLNSYRIPWVCQQLSDPSKKHLPILTLALEAGYGSIAPFNRAFKAQMGITPKQYRDQFQN